MTTGQQASGTGQGSPSQDGIPSTLRTGTIVAAAGQLAHAANDNAVLAE